MNKALQLIAALPVVRTAGCTQESSLGIKYPVVNDEYYIFAPGRERGRSDYLHVKDIPSWGVSTAAIEELISLGLAEICDPEPYYALVTLTDAGRAAMSTPVQVQGGKVVVMRRGKHHEGGCGSFRFRASAGVSYDFSPPPASRQYEFTGYDADIILSLPAVPTMTAEEHGRLVKWITEASRAVQGSALGLLAMLSGPRPPRAGLWAELTEDKDKLLFSVHIADVDGDILLTHVPNAVTTATMLPDYDWHGNHVYRAMGPCRWIALLHEEIEEEIIDANPHLYDTAPWSGSCNKEYMEAVDGERLRLYQRKNELHPDRRAWLQKRWDAAEDSGDKLLKSLYRLRVLSYSTKRQRRLQKLGYKLKGCNIMQLITASTAERQQPGRRA